MDEKQPVSCVKQFIAFIQVDLIFIKLTTFSTSIIEKPVIYRKYDCEIENQKIFQFFLGWKTP